MMTHPTLAILVELNRYFRCNQAEACRFQNHFAGILPRLRLEIDAVQSRTSEATHSTMDIGVTTLIDPIQDPGGKRSAEVPM